MRLKIVAPILLLGVSLMGSSAAMAKEACDMSAGETAMSSCADPKDGKCSGFVDMNGKSHNCMLKKDKCEPSKKACKAAKKSS